MTRLASERLWRIRYWGLVVILLGILLENLLEFHDARLVLLDAQRRARA